MGSLMVASELNLRGARTMRSEFEREVEAARWEVKQGDEAVRRELGENLEAVRRQALEKMGHAASLKKADMRKANALLHELEQHLLNQTCDSDSPKRRREHHPR